MRPAHRRGFEHLQVDGLLDRAQPLAADGLGIGEVEPQPVGLDLAAGLLGVLAQDAVQGVVQQVRRRVGAADRLRGDRRRPRREPAALTVTVPSDNPADVEDEVVLLLGVVHLERRTARP